MSVRRALPADDEAVALLLHEYLVWGTQRLLEEYGVAIATGDPSGARAWLASMRAQGAVVLVAEQDGEATGMGTVRLVQPAAAEIKRMYVRPAARRQGAAGMILDHLIDEASAFGATTLLLDTGNFQAEAQALYRSRGFRVRAPYEGSETPPALLHHWQFYERALTPRAGEE